MPSMPACWMQIRRYCDSFPLYFFLNPLPEQGSAMLEPTLSCCIDLMCSRCLSSHSDAVDNVTFAVDCLENRNQWLATNGSCDSSGYSHTNFNDVKSLETSQEYLLTLRNACTSLLGLVRSCPRCRHVGNSIYINVTNVCLSVGSVTSTLY